MPSRWHLSTKVRGVDASPMPARPTSAPPLAFPRRAGFSGGRPASATDASGARTQQAIVFRVAEQPNLLFCLKIRA